MALTKIMRLATLLAATSAQLVAGDNVLAPLGGQEPQTTSPIPTSNRYIVQFSNSTAKFRKRSGVIDTTSFATTVAETTGVNTTAALTFDSALFTGVSIDIKDVNATSIAQIEKIDGVERVWQAGIFTLPITGAAVTQDNGSSPLWSPHVVTRVNELHNRNIKGSGVVVAIVDSGVDYLHPALGGGFGAGFKVESGFDLVGDSYSAGGTAIPDPDPMDCHGHGTHVAGIIGSSAEYNPGVAPDARLRMYKVFGCSDGVTEDIVMQGFIRAYDDGADIITASLGSVQGFPYIPIATVASRIQAAGTFVSFANGNSGAYGLFYTGSGANGFDITAVGSVNHKDLVAYQVVAKASDGTSRTITYSSEGQVEWALNGTVNGSFDANARTRNNCDYLTRHPRVTSGNILLLKRGDCPWSSMDIQLYDRVQWAFYWNGQNASWGVPLRAITDAGLQAKGIALISYEDGEWLQGKYEANNTVQYDFSGDMKPIAIKDGASSGGVSSFSSWGPTLDARMKPSILAPGGNILSTYPRALGKWAVLSGTSMATPYIAGVAALFYGSRGGKSAIGSKAAALAHSRIVNTGTPMGSHPVAQAGGGLVDAVSVIDVNTTINPPNLDLNDTSNFWGLRAIEITNGGSEPVTYQFTHLPAETALTYNDGGVAVSTSPEFVSGYDYYATVTFQSQNITIAAGATQSLVLTFKEPARGDTGKLPVYGGTIVVAGSNGETVRVPYMGIKGSLYDRTIWQVDLFAPVFLRNTENSLRYLLNDGDTFTTYSSREGPSVAYNILWSTEEFSFEYVSTNWSTSDWSYPPVAGKNNYYGAINGYGLIPPQYNYPRIPNGVFESGSGHLYSDNSKVAPGKYRILARTLKTYGDRNKIQDWQYRLSPWFEIIAGNETTTTSAAPTPTSTTSTSTLPPTPLATCGASIPVDIRARPQSFKETFGLCQYSNFLAYDMAGTATYYEFALTSEGYIKARLPGSNSVVYASVHTNNNSLIYMYSASQISGSWSYLKCTENGTELVCESNGKSQFYFCNTQNTIPFRHGPSVPSDCFSLTLEFSKLTQNCSTNSTTSSLPVSQSATVTATSSSSVASSTISSSVLPPPTSGASSTAAPTSTTLSTSRTSSDGLTTSTDSTATSSLLTKTVYSTSGTALVPVSTTVCKLRSTSLTLGSATATPTTVVVA